MSSRIANVDPSATVSRLRERMERAGRWRLGLAGVCTIAAIFILSPMGWLVREAVGVERARAFDLLFSGDTWSILTNSIWLMMTVAAASILIGVPLAVLTTRTDLPYPRFWTIVAALPLVIPSYIGAIAFVNMFGSGGQIDTLYGFALPRVDGLRGAIFIITLYTYPYVFLTARAALLSMDRSLLDAARTLNHGPIGTFRRVTLPQIRPGIAAGALLAGLYAISDFGTPVFMQASVFTSSIYWQFSRLGDGTAYAALLSLQLIAIVAIVLVIEAGIGRDEDASGGTSSGRTIRLGWWKWPAMGSIATIGVLTLVVPVVIFGLWIFRSQGDPIPAFEFGPQIAFNSVYLATAAAIVAVLVALPVAYYSGQTNSWYARLLERATYIGFAVPGIVIGLALVFLGTRTVPWLYRQGIWLLVFAYVVRFIPQAVGTIRSSVLQVDDRTLEAARTLNAGPLEAFRRITLPAIMPGIVAGAALVFLTTMKELPATLLLRPIGKHTLVSTIWEAQSALAYRYAAIPALVLILLSGLSMLILLRQEGDSLT